MLLASLLLAAVLSKADVPRVTPAELHALMQKGEAVAVDVRGSVPFENGHIAGAVWMPLGMMSQRAGELPEEKLMVAYCTCKLEETSLDGAVLLAGLGFRVAVLKGGYPAWAEAGLPVETNRDRGGRGGRLAPPAAVTCDRNELTSHAGKVKIYRRGQDKTVLVLDTSADTTETITLFHSGSDDPSRHFLIDGTPFTAGDWPRIELSRGEIRPGLGAVVWVCSDGRTVVDWRPGTTYAGNE